MPNLLLNVHELTKEYTPGKAAVERVSFALYKGEILGILGPNGAGKTTILQMLTGVLTPTRGDIFVFGKFLSKHREYILERINFSSTYTNLPWLLTVEESLTFISYLYDIKNRKKRLQRLYSIFRLNEIWEKPIRRLSAGQLTRVNLAKALVNFPRILFLDEPTASLDPEVALYIREFLLKEREQFNVSIVMTSHNMAEVEELCDRIIFLHKGKILDEGTPEDLAAKVRVSHLNLLITDGLARTINLCNKLELKYVLQKRHIVIDIDERKVAWFLNLLAKKGVEYQEISIDKPDLEDYFLEVVKRKDENA